MKSLDVDATIPVARTKSLPSYLRGLHGTRLWCILQLRDSRSYASTPTHLDHRSRIHRYKSKYPAKRLILSRDQWLPGEHWQASELPPGRIAESFRKRAVSLFSMYLEHGCPLCDFDDFPGLFDFLYALTQCKLHRT